MKRLPTPAELMSEAQLQQAVIELAELFGWLVYHVVNVKRQLRNRTSVGFPDLVMACPERVLFRELKRQGKGPTAAQRSWLDTLSMSGQDAAVWHPQDLIDGTIERALRRCR